MNHVQAFNRIRDVRDEYRSTVFALSHTLISIESDSSLLNTLTEPLAPQQLRNSAKNVEMTYLLRLFATFEGTLRDYWAAARPSPRPRRTQMQILMNRVVILCQIPSRVADDAHAVREFRNAVVHPQIAVSPLTFDQCKSRLAFFLSYLPRQW
jgi:hypothetical protein